MFAEFRTTGSTPEVWSEHFAHFRPMRPLGALRMRLMPEWRLIKKYVPRRAAVLDAGCGIGDWARLMARAGRRVTGLDYSAALIRRLRSAYPDQAWVEGDIRRMPFDAGAFDAVISWGVIEHDERGPRAALREFRRLLAPCGVAMVSVPNDTPLRHRLAQARATAEASKSFFQYFMTADELAAEVRAAGFDVVECGAIRWPDLDLAFPRARARLPPRLFYVAAMLFPLLIFWWRRFDRSVVCVARRREEEE